MTCALFIGRLSKCAVDVNVSRKQQYQSARTTGRLASQWMKFSTAGISIISKCKIMHQLLHAQNLMMLLQTLHLQVTYAMMRQPWIEEVQKAIRKLRNGRAARPDEITQELLKTAEIPISIALHELFLRIWKSGKVPAVCRLERGRDHITL